MVSFGNASGPDPVNVPKDIQSKSLFLIDLQLVTILQIEKNFKKS